MFTIMKVNKHAINIIRTNTHEIERFKSRNAFSGTMLSKKDIIVINQQFSSGRIVNEGSLDYAIDTVRQSGNWLKTAAIICRAVLIDHVFEDGNKRTAAAVMRACAEINGVLLSPDSVNRAIVSMMRKNMTDIRIIERLIKDAIK